MAKKEIELPEGYLESFPTDALKDREIGRLSQLICDARGEIARIKEEIKPHKDEIKEFEGRIEALVYAKKGN